MPPPSSRIVRSSSRRDFLSSTTSAAAALTLGTLGTPAAQASGGATAGKTTSIPRAKTRYYGRVTAAVAAFEALALSVKDADLKGAFAKAFFADSADEADESPYSAFKMAGYLLAVAFKIDSKVPPDKIQQVKDYKKFMKALDTLKDAVERNKVKDVEAAYATTKTTLDVFLEGVELPPVGDAAYAKDGGSSCAFFKGAC